MSTGIRNNNYLNVKNSGSAWLDANGKASKTDERGHAVFTDPAYGVRAGIILLRVYYTKHKLTTIAKILSRWAPATDTIGSLPGGPKNSPKAYSEFVAGKMGIGPNDKLDLFDEEGDIEELDQLKKLFFAMAIYEIGQVNGKSFKVPEKDWSAGVELVEPNIKANGTETTDIAADSQVETAIGPQITSSVGDKSKGATNAKSDVLVVQELLTKAAVILKNTNIDPGGIDGKIDATKSNTVKAIVAFQARYFTNPDGLIEPGKRTWRELTGLVSAGKQAKIKSGVSLTSSNIPSTGYCLYLKRVRQETRSGMSYARTVGDFECFWNGKSTGLSGQIVERGGPGNNTYKIGNLQDRRIKAGSYPLSIHAGAKYRTHNYDSDVTTSGKPKPGLLLNSTGERTAILIHPGINYVSSVGCLNPATGLTKASSKIDFTTSRALTIAIILDIKDKLGSSFPASGGIPGATILIEGEPV